MTNPDPKKILIVDDENDIVKFLKTACEDAGFSTVTASNGAEALECIKKETPDIISLDIVMPKGSGVKFHRELKKNDAWAKIPVIVVTGHARDDLGKNDLEEMTMSGPGVYLEKPVSAPRYVDAINQILGDGPAKARDETDIRQVIKSKIDSADPTTLKQILDKLET